METIKVNMTPCDEVQTIHASQNDGDARQWEFELHNNGELIDTSDVKEQLVFKAYKGGTEQLLPENGSTPTTSPFKGDIKYPQGLLSDQEFLYRESPTEEDGLAKIQTIYGNTLKWNQLMRDITDVSNYSGNGGTVSYSDGSILFSLTSGSSARNFGQKTNVSATSVTGHKYFYSCDLTLSKVNGNVGIAPRIGQILYFSGFANGVKKNIVSIFESTDETALRSFIYPYGTGGYTSDGTETVLLQNPMIIDLTAMFGSTKADEIYAMEQAQSGSGIAYFRSLYPLPFYSYDSGSLLPFRGEVLKTVGFNQWDEETRTDGFFDGNGNWVSGNYLSSVNPISVLPDTTYYLCEKDGTAPIYATQWTEPVQSGSTHSPQFIRRDGVENGGFRTDPNCHAIHINCGSAYGNVYKNNICINISDPSKNGTYEPYISSTLSLPISTYFPTGMKDVPDYTNGGKIYDEWTPSKATTRIGVVNLGSLTWQYYSSRSNFYAIIPDIAVPTNTNIKANAKCILGEPITWNEMLANANENGTYAVMQFNTEKRFYIKNTNYSSVTDFMQYVNDVYLYYELETETEISFTTASLVTENAEIPLSNEDGILIGKCTEQLSENPGFIDAKIKLSDSDGECYSNKIQLHVERSPQ